MVKDIFSKLGGSGKGIVKAVSWDVATSDMIAHRFNNITLNYGSQVIVKENQLAVFFKDGKMYDVFRPGRHTITSANIPLLTGALKKLRIIGNIFNCEIIFLNTSQIRGNFGGSAYSGKSGKIEYSASIKFFGYYIFKIENPTLFVTEFFAQRNLAYSEEIEDYIRGFVNQRIIEEFGKSDIFEITQKLEFITEKINNKISKESSLIGIKIINLKFEGIEIPEEARRFVSKIGDKAMAMQYMKETAGELKGTEGGGAAAAGVGLGTGAAIPWMMFQQMGQSGQKTLVVCPFCGYKNLEGAKFCSNCGKSLVPQKVLCPKCNTEVDIGTKFCPNCGKNLSIQKIKCPKCGSEVQEGTKFCPECGTKL